MKPEFASLDLPSGWCTYMLIGTDGSYYVGLTHDLRQRILDHSFGKGPTYTKLTKPKLLVWFESTPPREAASAREKQLKSWTLTKKHALARGELRLGPAAQNLCLSLS
jgi:putative endonuclease